MHNDRNVEDPNMQEALEKIKDIFQYYDLAGGVVVVNPNEWAYTYSLETTWNAITGDLSAPLGFRLRAKSDELEQEIVKERVSNTAHFFCSMIDFSTQTKLWFNDLKNILQKSGIRIHHVSFGGKKIPRITGL